MFYSSVSPQTQEKNNINKKERQLVCECHVTMVNNCGTPFMYCFNNPKFRILNSFRVWSFSISQWPFLLLKGLHDSLSSSMDRMGRNGVFYSRNVSCSKSETGSVLSNALPFTRYGEMIKVPECERIGWAGQQSPLHCGWEQVLSSRDVCQQHL